jgi:hypothetical protein
VVVARNADSDPRNQVFLVFSDGTSFEFWGENFSCAGGVDRKGLEEVIRYAKKLGASISKIYPDSMTD